MKKLFIKIILPFLLVASQSALSYECSGKVRMLVLGPGGSLTVYHGGMNAVVLCSVNEKTNNVPPEACKSIQSLLMAAKLADRNVTFWFSDASGSCTNASHPAWEELKNWYWGPSID